MLIYVFTTKVTVAGLTRWNKQVVAKCSEGVSDCIVGDVTKKFSKYRYKIKLLCCASLLPYLNDMLNFAKIGMLS